MKIKITEDQAKRLNLISENADPISKFEYMCKVRLEDINKWYLKVTNLTIGEILHNEVNMQSINDILDKIEGELQVAYKQAYSYVESSADGSDARIDKADSMVMDKLTPLQLIAMDLEKLQLSSEQHNVTQPFTDIRQIQ